MGKEEAEENLCDRNVVLLNGITLNHKATNKFDIAQ